LLTPALDHNTKQESTEDDLRKRKEHQIAKDNIKVNKGRKTYFYKIDELVLVENPIPDKLDTRWLGPYPISRTTEKGYVYAKINNQEQRINIKRIKPFLTGEAYHGQDLV
jgi:hypothetical protein